MEKAVIAQDTESLPGIPGPLDNSSSTGIPPAVDVDGQGYQENEDESRHEAIGRRNSDFRSASNDEGGSQPAPLETFNRGLESDQNIGLGGFLNLENDITLPGRKESLITSTITLLPNPNPSETLRTSIEAVQDVVPSKSDRVDVAIAEDVENLVETSVQVSSELETPHLPAPTPTKCQPVLKTWTPHDLRPWFLTIFLLFQLCIMGGITVIIILSKKRSGLTTINENDSWSKTFTWAYLPTGIALIVGICWAAIDLDVVRTEPYVRLSQTQGTELAAIFDQTLLNPFLAFLSLAKSLNPRRRRKTRYTAVVFCSVIAHLISLLTVLIADFFSTNI